MSDLLAPLYRKFLDKKDQNAFADFALLRRPGNYAKGVYLTKQKTKDLMLVYQESDIPRSLFKLSTEFCGGDKESQRIKRQAPGIFKKILTFAGDGKRTSLADRVQAASDVLKTGSREELLRDEIFCQLVKQTRECPKPDVALRSWQLIYCAARSFQPSSDFRPFLLSHAAKYAHRECPHEQDMPTLDTIADVATNLFFALPEHKYYRYKMRHVKDTQLRLLVNDQPYEELLPKVPWDKIRAKAAERPDAKTERARQAESKRQAFLKDEIVIPVADKRSVPAIPENGVPAMRAPPPIMPSPTGGRSGPPSRPPVPSTRSSVSSVASAIVAPPPPPDDGEEDSSSDEGEAPAPRPGSRVPPLPRGSVQSKVLPPPPRGSLPSATTSTSSMVVAPPPMGLSSRGSTSVGSRGSVQLPPPPRGSLPSAVTSTASLVVAPPSALPAPKPAAQPRTVPPGPPPAAAGPSSRRGPPAFPGKKKVPAGPPPATAGPSSRRGPPAFPGKKKAPPALAGRKGPKSRGLLAKRGGRQSRQLDDIVIGGPPKTEAPKAEAPTTKPKPRLGQGVAGGREIRFAESKTAAARPAGPPARGGDVKRPPAAAMKKSIPTAAARRRFSSSGVALPPPPSDNQEDDSDEAEMKRKSESKTGMKRASSIFRDASVATTKFSKTENEDQGGVSGILLPPSLDELEDEKELTMEEMSDQLNGLLQEIQA